MLTGKSSDNGRRLFVARQLRHLIVHVSHPSAVPDLLEWLARRPDVIAARTGDHEIEASLLGSRRSPWNERELERRLRAWQAERPAVEVEIRPSTGELVDDELEPPAEVGRIGS